MLLALELAFLGPLVEREGDVVFENEVAEGAAASAEDDDAHCYCWRGGGSGVRTGFRRRGV